MEYLTWEPGLTAVLRWETAVVAVKSRWRSPKIVIGPSKPGSVGLI